MDLRHRLSHLPTRTFLTLICLLSWTAGAVADDQPQSKQRQGRNLLRFGADFDLRRVDTTDAEVSLVSEGGLSVRTGHENEWPGIALSPPAGSWDLSRYASVTTEVTNRGKEPVAVYCRVDNPGADGRKHCVTARRDLRAGERARLIVRVHTTPWRLSKPIELIGMRARPEHTGEFDPRNVSGAHHAARSREPHPLRRLEKRTEARGQRLFPGGETRRQVVAGRPRRPSLLVSWCRLREKLKRHTDQ